MLLESVEIVTLECWLLGILALLTSGMPRCLSTQAGMMPHAVVAQMPMQTRNSSAPRQTVSPESELARPWVE